MIDWWTGGALGPAGTLEWTGQPWAIVCAIGMSCLLLVLAFKGERSISARVLECVFWAAGLGLLCVALAGPVWVEEEGRVEPGRLAVLIDASRSMSVIENGKPRSESVVQILEHLDGEDVDWYHYGAELAVGTPTEFDFGNTDLESALAALSERVAGDRLAGVVVITDGLDRGLLRKRFRRNAGADLQDLLPGPLTIYQVGQPGKVSDLSIRDVDAGGFAFKLEEFTVKAHLLGVGFEGRTIPVQLERDGSPVSSLQVTLDEAGVGEAVFRIRPDRVGRFTYEVSVPDYDNDAVPSNNRAPVVMRVVRDRIRVLQVAGSPSWDVKVLRRFLKGDPSVDLVSFFILRTNEDIDASYGDNELSLIQFPTEKLFNEELWNFDLVVFQNFDYEPFFGYAADGMLDNIRRYVEDEGHAFVMTGGDRSFDLGKYQGTPLERILPLTLGVVGQKADEASFHPALTEAGRRHPITRLTQDAEENQRWWERLHASDGTNLVQGAAKDASVLLVHPERKTSSGQPAPVLAVKEAGRGRTMALTTDSSWRWSFSEAAAGRGNQAYLRFWKNAFHWLLAEPTANRVVVETARENYRVGDTVRVVVHARNINFEPMPGASVQVTVHRMEEVKEYSGVTGPDGEIVFEIPAAKQGPHRVNAKVSLKEQLAGESETVFAVSTRDPELEEVSVDVSFLRWLADRTEGSYHEPGDLSGPVRDITSGRKVWDRRETRLANAPGLAVLILLCCGLGWVVRRRSGLR